MLRIPATISRIPTNRALPTPRMYFPLGQLVRYRTSRAIVSPETYMSSRARSDHVNITSDARYFAPSGTDALPGGRTVGISVAAGTRDAGREYQQQRRCQPVSYTHL